jgi:flavin-dependent dehydrogenase
MPRAWAWMIPISQTITSVGVVTDATAFSQSGQSVEEYFARYIASHPLLVWRMAKAHPIQEFFREGNYSHTMERFTGNGWLLVGDAARFVDPIFSSGVSVAMESAQRAAHAIVRALARDDVSASAFADYERTVRAGVEIWREFIVLYYQLPALFLDLLSRPDTCRQLTLLLQGDVYERASVPILKQMRAMLKRVAEDPQHPWHAQLGK